MTGVSFIILFYFFAMLRYHVLLKTDAAMGSSSDRKIFQAF